MKLLYIVSGCALVTLGLEGWTNLLELPLDICSAQRRSLPSRRHCRQERTRASCSSEGRCECRGGGVPIKVRDATRAIAITSSHVSIKFACSSVGIR